MRSTNQIDLALNAVGTIHTFHHYSSALLHTGATVVTTQGNAKTPVVVEARVSKYKVGMEPKRISIGELSLATGDRYDRHL